MNIRPLPDGSLLALFRSRWADAMYRSVSYDDGESWAQPRPLDLPNNNSSIQYAPLADGRLALVYNHSSAADAVARRVSLYDEIDDDGLSTAPGRAGTRPPRPRRPPPSRRPPPRPRPEPPSGAPPRAAHPRRLLGRRPDLAGAPGPGDR